MKRAKHEYLVGWKGDHQCVYGKNLNGHANWVDRFTLWQAKKLAASLSGRGTVVIYRLVAEKS